MRRLLAWILRAGLCPHYLNVPHVSLRGLPTYVPQKVSISPLLLEYTIYVTKDHAAGVREIIILRKGNMQHFLFPSQKTLCFPSVWVLATNYILLFDLEMLASKFWTRQLGRNRNNIWVSVWGCVLLSRVSLAHWWQIVHHTYLEFSACLTLILVWTRIFFTVCKGYSSKHLEKNKDVSERHHTR